MVNAKYLDKQTTDEQFLGHVVEEAGEVLCAIGKVLRFGPNSSNPELPEAERETNREWLLREVMDLQGALGRLLHRAYAPDEIARERSKRTLKPNEGPTNRLWFGPLEPFEDSQGGGRKRRVYLRRSDGPNNLIGHLYPPTFRDPSIIFNDAHGNSIKSLSLNIVLRQLENRHNAVPVVPGDFP